MPRDRKAKAAAQVPAPAVTPEAPAPAEQQGNRSPLSAATGTDHKGLQNALLSDVVAALGIPSDSEAHATRSGAAVGMMAGFAPRDAIEGALAAQFTALHHAGMTALRRAANPHLPPEISSRLRRDATAMFRTAAEAVGAIETRRGNTVCQRVIVERVVVQEGGQAVVGAIADRGRGV